MNKRAYKFRFYPTDEQKTLLAQTFGCVRYVWNHVLKWRTEAYYNEKLKIGYVEANAELTRMKKLEEYSFLNDVSSVPLQQCLRHQQEAFKKFFKEGAGYPAFKNKRSKQSASFMTSAFSYRDGKLLIAKSKTPLKVKWSRELPSKISSITISKDSADRYFVSCLCEFEAEKLQISPKTIGIDLGIKSLFVTDTGEKIGNPRNTQKYEAKLAKAQRKLAKKQKGSANRAKAKAKVARIHAKIADSRLDNLHNLSRRLINENQVICVETLKVKNMIRNPKLSKHIADASWGEFVRQLQYKAEWAGRTISMIDQFYPSSKRCSCCGYIADKMTLNIRSWSCPSCNEEHDRDVNAAKNIKAAGLAVLACGDAVSPT